MFSVFTVFDKIGSDFFFQFIGMSWMLLCTISQSTYFVASYTGILDRLLVRIKLSQESAQYCRKMAAIFALIAWIFLFMNYAGLLYSIFFSGGSLDVMLAPINVHFNVQNVLVPRIVLFVINIPLYAAWIFPHVISLMLATLFSYQYKTLDQTLEQQLLSCDERRVSDMKIETLRQCHQEICSSVKETDKFLMFSNAGAFCCQLLGTILLLYTLIFFYFTMSDPVLFIKRTFWLLGQAFGLSVTAAAGIMVNHYVSINIFFIVLTKERKQEKNHNSLSTLHVVAMTLGLCKKED